MNDEVSGDMTIAAAGSSNYITPPDVQAVIDLVIQGNLGRLSPIQRAKYLTHLAVSRGLDPSTNPFQIIKLGGRDVVYATRDAAEQLRRRDDVSINIVSRNLDMENGIHEVVARAKNGQGRVDESSGCVSVYGLKGEALANAMMKAETKAKRRVTLSICGLGFLDELEVESVLGQQSQGVAPSSIFQQAAPPSSITPSPTTPPTFDPPKHAEGDPFAGADEPPAIPKANIKSSKASLPPAVPPTTI